MDEKNEGTESFSVTPAPLSDVLWDIVAGNTQATLTVHLASSLKTGSYDMSLIVDASWQGYEASPIVNIQASGDESSGVAQLTGEAVFHNLGAGTVQYAAALYVVAEVNNTRLLMYVQDWSDSINRFIEPGATKFTLAISAFKWGTGN